MSISFNIKTRSAVAFAAFGGTTKKLITIAGYTIVGAITPTCETGSVVVDSIAPESPETTFEGFTNVEYRLVNGQTPLNPVPGMTRISAARIAVRNIAVESQVAIRRNLNTLLGAGRKGPNSRPLAIPQYQIQARAVITYDWKSTREIQTYTEDANGDGGWKASPEVADGQGSAREEGQWGDRIFLREAVCAEFEPPVGVIYNQFVTIQVGKSVTNLTPV